MVSARGLTPTPITAATVCGVLQHREMLNTVTVLSVRLATYAVPPPGANTMSIGPRPVAIGAKTYFAVVSIGLIVLSP